jgi:RNA-binding protein YhbY
MRQLKKLQMGKNGLSDAFLEQVKTVLETEKVLKISILKSACRDKAEAKEIAEKLIGELGSKYNYRLVGYVITIVKFRKAQR